MKAQLFYQIVHNQLKKMDYELTSKEAIFKLQNGIRMYIKKEHESDTGCVVSFIYQTSVRCFANQAYFKQNADLTYSELLQIDSPLSKTGAKGLIDKSIDEQWYFNSEKLQHGRLIRLPYRDCFLHHFYKK